MYCGGGGWEREGGGGLERERWWGGGGLGERGGEGGFGRERDVPYIHIIKEPVCVIMVSTRVSLEEVCVRKHKNV